MEQPAATMGPATPFSYRCTRCNRCCTGKRVQVNPYEIARLARAKGVSTSEARAFFTANGALRQDDVDRCIFLGEDGCGVHADRPLVCRLFPLGRVVAADGAAHFVMLDRNWARGEFGEAGMVADYVAAQGAAPFIAAADAYFAWYCRARERLAAGMPDETAGKSTDLLDIDGQLAAHCRAQGMVEPADLEARLALHLAILDAELEGEGDDDG
ncbi:YkgJ family cysteine cluster protein [Sphingomonas sp. RT2P30]|uniref:YkgJ family cysteine cluster protein n=1 Tax=Parasphingomonas halimpatiens TaxID=3096162 RepID=UPI002FC58EA1